ncbi:MAG: hypothetical protein PVJ76_16225 [Gemmatimonadota bacterium]
MDVDRLSQVPLDLDAAEPTPGETTARYGEVAERLRRVPGVRGVGLSDLPLGWI